MFADSFDILGPDIGLEKTKPLTPALCVDLLILKEQSASSAYLLVFGRCGFHLLLVLLCHQVREGLVFHVQFRLLVLLERARVSTQTLPPES